MLQVAMSICSEGITSLYRASDKIDFEENSEITFLISHVVMHH